MERIKQKLDVARKQREQFQNGYTTSAESVGHREWNASMSEKNRFMALKGNHTRLLLAVVVIIMSAMIIWWGVSSSERDVIRLSDIEMFESQQASAAGSTAVERMDMKIAGLAERVDSLTESITQLETKLISVHLTTDSIIVAKATQPPTTSTTQHTIAKAEHILETLPPPASGKIDKETSVAIAPRPSSGGTASAPSVTPTAKEHQPTLTNDGPAIKTSKDGPWVINLVSTSRKADADRLTKKALSKGISTEQQQITVKGAQYWRVQITGFPTAENAKAYADTAKEQLGLKDAWIMKR
jgi:cell division septation protein DedD